MCIGSSVSGASVDVDEDDVEVVEMYGCAIAQRYAATASPVEVASAVKLCTRTTRSRIRNRPSTTEWHSGGEELYLAQFEPG